MPEFTITRENLLNALLTVNGAVDRKQSKAILGNVLINHGENELVLTATDLEMQITAWTKCNAGSPGMTTVSARKFIDITRSFEDDAELAIAFDDKIMRIVAGKSKFVLGVLPANEYPGFEEGVNEIELTLPRAEILEILNRTSFAMAQSDVRVFFNGLLLEAGSGMLTAVAADGHRMAIYRIKAPLITREVPARFLLPRNAVSEIMRLLNSINDETVDFYAGSNHIRIMTQKFSFLSRLIEASYPGYERAIPRNHERKIILEADALKRALLRMIILANEKTRAIILSMEANQVTITTNNRDQEEAVEVLAAETTGDPLKIGINASYLLDVLNCMDHTRIVMFLGKEDSSILVESGQQELYHYIIMPMKI